VLRSPTPLLVLIAAVVLAVPRTSDADDPRWTVPRYAEPPITQDGGHVIEGTGTTPKWAWRASLGLRYAYDLGLADRASQTLADLVFGVGLPLDLEVALGLPVGWTFGAKEPAALSGAPREYRGMGESGPGIGDLRAALLWSYVSAGEGGLGLLVGLEGSAPTGDHERLLGEGGLAAEPFVALAFQVLSTRISFNFGYRIRPEHVAHVGQRRFEQDDELIWRVGVRVPRKNDIAWSVEAEGAVGTATREGFWPDSDSRPVWLGAGVDFPLSRAYRLGMVAGFGLVGEAVPLFTAGLRFTWNPVLPDEDRDGVGGVADQCPLLAEDLDGTDDDDGCPDLDNDGDGFPDDEDACPDQPAGDFSDDGC